MEVLILLLAFAVISGLSYLLMIFFRRFTKVSPHRNGLDIFIFIISFCAILGISVFIFIANVTIER